MNCSNDHELFVFMREQLSSSLLSDALDEIGLRAQTMRENIRPCWRGAVVAGRAHTAAYAGVYDVTTKRDPANALTLMDSLQPDEVAGRKRNRGFTVPGVWTRRPSVNGKRKNAFGSP